MHNQVISELNKIGNPDKAKVLAGFFKTGKGQYGEGDKFLGITVPEQRKIAKKFKALDFKDLKKLLSNEIHEYRLTALLILVERFEIEKEAVFKFYLENLKFINNWDLVDLSADKILGKYLIYKDKEILYKLAASGSIWERRVAILSTFAFIKAGMFDDTLAISEFLLHDKHDLIQKAVGWMLREIGKRNLKVEEKFLMKHHKTMPRTCLRYAIERFDKTKKTFFMKK